MTRVYSEYLSPGLNLPGYNLCKLDGGVSLRLSMLDEVAFILSQVSSFYTPRSSTELDFFLEGDNQAYLLLEIFDGEGNAISESCPWEIKNFSVLEKSYR